MRVNSFPKFGSTILLVSRETFDEVVQKSIPGYRPEMKCRYEARPPYTISNRLRMQPKGFTLDARNCNVAGVTNAKRLTLVHLDPSNRRRLFDPEKACLELQRDIVELERDEDSQPLSALLTGGWVFDSLMGEQIQARNESVDLYKILETFLKRVVGDRLSILWGRAEKPITQYAEVHAFYDGALDTWCLNMEKYKGEDILRLADLRAFFRVVEIAPSDTLLTPEDKGYRRALVKFLR